MKKFIIPPAKTDPLSQEFLTRVLIDLVQIPSENPGAYEFTAWLQSHGVDFAQTPRGRWLIEGQNGWVECGPGDIVALAIVEGTKSKPREVTATVKSA